MLGMKRLPGADAPGDWLRRMGQSRAGLRGLEALNRQLLKAALGTRRSVTLDLDATAILCNKRETRYPYQKERGYMPMVRHIAEVGMIVSQQFRHGNVPPSKDNMGFIVQCGAALPTGVKIGHLRIDAAGYQAAILDHAAAQGMAFAIRATLSKSLREQIQGLAASAWQPVVDRAGRSSEERVELSACAQHGASKRAFTLALQRRPKWGQQSLDVGCGVGTDTDEQGGYVYRAIAVQHGAGEGEHHPGAAGLALTRPVDVAEAQDRTPAAHSAAAGSPCRTHSPWPPAGRTQGLAHIRPRRQVHPPPLASPPQGNHRGRRPRRRPP